MRHIYRLHNINVTRGYTGSREEKTNEQKKRQQQQQRAGKFSEDQCLLLLLLRRLLLLALPLTQAERGGGGVLSLSPLFIHTYLRCIFSPVFFSLSLSQSVIHSYLIIRKNEKRASPFSPLSTSTYTDVHESILMLQDNSE